MLHKSSFLDRKFYYFDNAYDLLEFSLKIIYFLLNSTIYNIFMKLNVFSRMFGFCVQSAEI